MTDTEIHVLILEDVLGYHKTVKTCGPSDFFIEGTQIERWKNGDDKEVFARVTSPSGEVELCSTPSYELLYPQSLDKAVKIAEKVGLFETFCLHQTFSRVWQLGMYFTQEEGGAKFIPSLEDRNLSHLLCRGSLRHIGCPEVPAL